MQCVELVEIEGEKEDAIDKAVAPRQKALVQDAALIKAGVHRECTVQTNRGMQGLGQFMPDSLDRKWLRRPTDRARGSDGTN